MGRSKKLPTIHEGINKTYEGEGGEIKEDLIHEGIHEGIHQDVNKHTAGNAKEQRREEGEKVSSINGA